MVFLRKTIVIRISITYFTEKNKQTKKQQQQLLPNVLSRYLLIFLLIGQWHIYITV